MMPLNNASTPFEQRYASHLKHLTLQGFQPKNGGHLSPRRALHGRTV